jgi:putative transcriptional regulator
MFRVFCALLAAGGFAWPSLAADTKPLTTMLLVARDGLPDPNFRDSVVLVMNHLAAAPTGVILNRPTSIPVSHLFPGVERLARLEAKVYFGGPVDLPSVSFLFRAGERPEHAVEVIDGIYFGTSRELLRSLLDRDRPTEGLRIFVGHSGWAPGQLEAEIARGDWTLAPAEASTIFDRKGERPWPTPQVPGTVRRASRPELRPPGFFAAAWR